MSYAFNQAKDVTKIKEQEYGIAKKIGFTNFTSCAGIVGRTKSGEVCGLHLVQKGIDEKGNEAKFEIQPVLKAIEKIEFAEIDDDQIDDNKWDVVAIGYPNSFGQQTLAFIDLMSALHVADIFEEGSGLYSAEISGGHLVVSYKDSNGNERTIYPRKK